MRTRTTWCLAWTLLAGCTPTPPEVSTTGIESGDASSNGDGSTGIPAGSTSEGPATAASIEGTGSTGDATSTGVPLDDGTTTGEPGTSTTTDDASSSSTGSEPEECHPILAEVLYDALGGNNNKQWVKLYNPCNVEIELAGAYVLAYGGQSYAHGQYELDASLEPGACRVVGGPNSSNDNGNPVWGQNVDFSPDLQVGEDPAGGVGLFVGTADDVTEESVPVDAVIYGVSNDNGLVDAEGEAAEPHVIGVDQGESIRRTSLDAEWEVATTPTPNECPAL